MGASSREFCQIVTGSSDPHNLFTPISHQLGAVIESRENLQGCEEAVNRLCRPDEPVTIWQNSRSEVPIHTILSAFVPPGPNADGRRTKSGSPTSPTSPRRGAAESSLKVWPFAS